MSTKKSDQYLSRATQDVNGRPDAETPGSAYVMSATPTNENYGRVHMFLHMPTHRYLKADGPQLLASRTSTNPFIRGFKEVIQLSPNDGSAWWHRRIAFRLKGGAIFNQVIGIPSGVFGAQLNSTSGTSRTWRDLANIASNLNSPYTKVLDNLYDYLFQGVYTVDWNNAFTARTDNTRVTIISDKFRKITSGNASSRPSLQYNWHPVNKTLHYDDYENDVVMTTNPVSTSSKLGCGDVYVVDLFHCPVPVVATGASQSILTLSSTATLYWHEK